MTEYKVFQKLEPREGELEDEDWGWVGDYETSGGIDDALKKAAAALDPLGARSLTLVATPIRFWRPVEISSRVVVELKRL